MPAYRPGALRFESLQELGLGLRSGLRLVLEFLREPLRQSDVRYKKSLPLAYSKPGEQAETEDPLQIEGTGPSESWHSQAPSPSLLADTENARDAIGATRAATAARATPRVAERAASARDEEAVS